MFEFLGPGSDLVKNIGWPIKIEELHNKLKTVKNHSTMARNKIKVRIGHLLDAISSILVEDSISFLGKSILHSYIALALEPALRAGPSSH